MRRLQLVGSRLAHAVGLVTAGELPVALRVRFSQTTTLSSNRRLLNVKSVTPGVLRSQWLGVSVAFRDSVGVAVHCQIESGAKEMLVVLPDNTRSNFCPVLSRLARNTTNRVNNPSRLHLKLDGAVKEKVPVAAVLIVSHGRNAGDG